MLSLIPAILVLPAIPGRTLWKFSHFRGLSLNIQPLPWIQVSCIRKWPKCLWPLSLLNYIFSPSLDLRPHEEFPTTNWLRKRKPTLVTNSSGMICWHHQIWTALTSLPGTFLKNSGKEQFSKWAEILAVYLSIHLEGEKNRKKTKTDWGWTGHGHWWMPNLEPFTWSTNWWSLVPLNHFC